MIAGPAQISNTDLIGSFAIFAFIVVGVLVAGNPLVRLVRSRERRYGHVLRYGLLLDVPPRAVTFATLGVMLLLGFIGYSLLGGSVAAFIIAAGLGLLVPGAVLNVLRRRRLRRLDEQLVGGVQTLASGVRAGLNLVQSMQMLARDGPPPLRQEIAHMLREYEYGVPLDAAMDAAAERIGSSDYRLLFTALQTHRQRGGDLGETLDRIAESIREIQRLENRVETLTAQGRATARWLGAMPAVVMVIYYFIDSYGVQQLFVTASGKVILAGVVLANITGYLWIRRIMAIDI